MKTKESPGKKHFLFPFLSKRILFYMISLTAAFSFGAIAHRSGKLGKILMYMKTIPTYAPALIKAEPERITIDIKFKDFQKILAKREKVISDGILIASPLDYVDGKIRHKDKTLKVKLRLKGDWRYHLQHDKWSYRIIIKGDNALFGMKQFSIQHPEERNWLSEWFYHQVLKGEGIISLRYDFINVTINGKDLGIYAFEEHFEKRLIEHNKNCEGPIIKFNENIHWADRLAYLPLGTQSPTRLQQAHSSDIDAFKTNTIMQNPTLYRQFIIAKDLLESFRRGELPTEKVFDVDKLASFLALTEVMGGTHGLIWHNLRFYYNPISSKLEPIGFDANAGGRWTDNTEDLIRHKAWWYYRNIMDSRIFYEKYIQALARVTEKSYLDNQFEHLEKDLQRNLYIIQSEFPWYRFPKEVFYKNQEYIKKMLNPVKVLHAYFRRYSEGKIELNVGNIQVMPVEVLGVSLNGTDIKPAEEIILQEKSVGSPVEFRTVSFDLPEGTKWTDNMVSDLKVKYRLLGMDNAREVSVFSWQHLSENFIENDFIRQSPNVDKFKFLLVDAPNKTIFIKPGKWDIHRDLIIPEGFFVVGGEGVQLCLHNSSKILSYSPLLLTGSEEQPVLINSPDSTGQGIAVFEADNKSVLKHVIFSNLSNPSKGGWELTGAVTFYKSLVEISHCYFKNVRSEDALNIVNTTFRIENSFFENSHSDAFDSDFSRGDIYNSSFVKSGGDAIDVSGSIVKMNNIYVNVASDKGLSVGEQSVVMANNFHVTNSFIGIASKDLSEIELLGHKLSRCKIGFAVYKKKPEYGPASIRAKGWNMEKVKTPYLVEKGSSLYIDEKAIESYREKVWEYLYGQKTGN